jgi:hypothetical protein
LQYFFFDFPEKTEVFQAAGLAVERFEFFRPIIKITDFVGVWTSPSRVFEEARPLRVFKEARPDFGPFGTECGGKGVFYHRKYFYTTIKYYYRKYFLPAVVSGNSQILAKFLSFVVLPILLLLNFLSPVGCPVSAFFYQ